MSASVHRGRPPVRPWPGVRCQGVVGQLDHGDGECDCLVEQDIDLARAVIGHRHHRVALGEPAQLVGETLTGGGHRRGRNPCPPELVGGVTGEEAARTETDDADAFGLARDVDCLEQQESSTIRLGRARTASARSPISRIVPTCRPLPRGGLQAAGEREFGGGASRSAARPSKPSLRTVRITVASLASAASARRAADRCPTLCGWSAMNIATRASAGETRRGARRPGRRTTCSEHYPIDVGCSSDYIGDVTPK